MSQLEIHQIPVLQDNDVDLAHDAAGEATAVVDPAVAELAVVFPATRRRKDLF